jgi:hypothetical protein
MNFPTIRFHTDARPETFEHLANHGLCDLAATITWETGASARRDLVRVEGATLVTETTDGNRRFIDFLDTIAEIVVL